MPYRVGWEFYIGPVVERRKEWGQDSSGGGGSESGAFPPGTRPGQKFTGSINSDATPEQARAFLKSWCGDRVYTGPKWWLGEGGVTIYDGKEDAP